LHNLALYDKLTPLLVASLLAEAHYALSNLASAKQAIVASLSCFGEKAVGSKMFYRRLELHMNAYFCNRVARKAWLKDSGDYFAEARSRLINIEKSRAWYRLALITFMDNDPGLNMQCVVQGIFAAAKLGPSLELSNALSSMIPVMSSSGFHKYAETFSEAAMKMSQELQNKEAIAICAESRSLYLASKGNLQQSEEQLKSAKDICEGIGDTRLWNECNSLLCATLHAMGKYREELECSKTAVRITEQTTDKPTLITCLNNLVQALLAMGNYTEAKKVYERCDAEKFALMSGQSGQQQKMEAKGSEVRVIGGEEGNGEDEGAVAKGATRRKSVGKRVTSLDKIRLAGEKHTGEASRRHTQRLLLLLSAGKVEECYMVAQKIMENTKYLWESSYW